MSNKIINCPLLCGRSIKNSVLNKHITKECKKKDKLGMSFERCKHNYNHIIEISKLQEHQDKCPTKLEQEEEIKKKEIEKLKISEEKNNVDHGEEDSSEGEISLAKAYKEIEKKESDFDMNKKGFGNEIINSTENDITKKRNLKYKPKDKWENENLLLQAYNEDLEKFFFNKSDEMDSDTEDFYDFIYKGKSMKF